MNQSNLNRQAYLSLAAILFIAFALSLAGGSGGQQIGGVPLFALIVLLAFVINWLAFIPAFLQQTEHFFDLVGSLTNIAVVSVALFFGTAATLRDWVLWAFVVVWAGRLGWFLFRRVRRAGKDGRFDRLKTSGPRFLLTWSLQALWVIFTQAAALAALTTVEKRPFGILAVVGLLIWLAGFLIEVVADRQKSAFRAAPTNRDRFIQTGLWSWSRHPNYFGEILLWLGIAIIALPVLQGWQMVTLLSPLFVFVLLTRISGIPLLEARAEKKWGDDPAFLEYKRRTSRLIPRPPKQ